MLKIVCVNTDNYLGRGKEYVQILSDMVARNLPIGTTYEFLCWMDDKENYAPGIRKMKLHGNLKGWWNKLYLFKAGTFKPDDRIVYFDLDTVITGDLSDIIKYDGEFALLRDTYRTGGLQSSVMMWRGDFGANLWRSYEEAGFPDIEGGDQAWIESHQDDAEILQDKFPNQFVSYKAEAKAHIPLGAKVVFFHGEPRPHDAEGWVKSFWKIGGMNTLDSVVSNTGEEQLVANITHSTSLCRTWLDHVPAHEGHAVIIGGGPSLKKDITEIKRRFDEGQHIFTVNNSWRYLVENGINPNFHVMLDARPENADFIPPYNLFCTKYYASQCAREVWDKAPDARVWNHINALKIIENDKRANVYLAGGSTVGLNAMSLAHVLGYRKLHLYGFDSSYDDDKNHHAYVQKLNDKERILEVEAYGKTFLCAAWMAQQVNEFCILVPQLLNLGCEITVHGTGLLPYVASNMKSSELTETFDKDVIFTREN